MNSTTLYSLKCLFDGGGVLLVFEFYIFQNVSHTSIIGVKLTSICIYLLMAIRIVTARLKYWHYN